MSQKSNYLRDEILDHILGKGGADFTSPANLFVRLSTATLTSADTGSTITEPPGGNGYAGEAVTFAAASGGSKNPTVDLTFGPCTGTDWPTVTDGMVADANAAGQSLYFGAWNTPRTCVVGGSLTLASGDFTISEA